MLKDRHIIKAVSQILQRSEKQADIQKLLGTFVDVGILPLLENQNNQILYGRRGTGKTHVLKVLGSKLSEDKNNTVVYIDARTLGSSGQFSDPRVPMKYRCLALFRDILGPIQNELMEHIIEYPSENADRAFDAVDELAFTIVDPVKIYREDTVTTSTSTSTAGHVGGKLRLGYPPSASVSANVGIQESSEKQINKSYRVESEEKVIFPSLNHDLTKTLELANTNLYILLDEWASLPSDIQPYLAEFLKRGVLPVQRVVLKIASIEYRSRFSLREDESFWGFEVGADISTAPELDDYYVFDRNPDQVAKLYSDMLLRHLNVDLGENYLSSTYRINSGRDFTSRLFTETETFRELARAAEGVVRDLINIFTLAFFNAHKRGRENIDKRAVLEAARQWFEQDKAQHLDEQLQLVLRRILDEVIGKRRARSFLLPRNLEGYPLIKKLFDARVLHHIQRGYADKDNPGVRYNIYTLDYGTYVDLMGTSKQPAIEFLEEDSGPDLIVPFDDKRSIRRIILGEEVLQ